MFQTCLKIGTSVGMGVSIIRKVGRRQSEAGIFLSENFVISPILLDVQQIPKIVDELQKMRLTKKRYYGLLEFLLHVNTLLIHSGIWTDSHKV
ncbi:MAG: hypothetical protein MZV65_52985 [Chromatiales bacterium]|nr:hypothetical protein [Chromatiales bacterium]